MMQSLAFVWGLLYNSKRRHFVFAFIIVTFCQMTALLLQPIIIISVVREVFTGDLENFRKPLLYLLVFMTATPLLSYLGAWISNLILQDVRMRAKERLYSELLDKPLTFFRLRNQGLIETEISTASQAARMIVYDCVSTLIRASLFVLLTTALIAWVIPIYGVVFLGLSGAYFFLSHRLAARSSKHVDDAVRSTTKLSQESADMLSNIEAVQFNNTPKYELDRLGTFLENERAIYTTAQGVIDRAEFCQKLFLVLIFTAFIAAIAFVDSLDADATLLFYILGLMAYNQLDNTGKVLNSLFEQCGKLASVLRSIEYKKFVGVPTAQKQTIKPILKPTIELDRVFFCYKSYIPLLSNFCGKFPYGSRILIEGRSGCGKTTLLKLMTGELRPLRGSVLINDIIAHRLSLRDKSNLFALVSQHATLFDRSLYENVIYGQEPVDRTRVQRLLNSLGLHDQRSDQTTDWLDTPTGKNGLGFSGGERQRVLIARAILSAKPILILDEATSALDDATEKQVLDVIHQTLPGCTILAVSHHPHADLTGYSRVEL